MAFENRYMAFDLSFDEGGEHFAAQVVYTGKVYIHLKQPIVRDIERGGGCFSGTRFFKTEKQVCDYAKANIREVYQGYLRAEAERKSHTREEWAQMARDAKRRIAALNRKMYMMSKLIKGSSKTDLLLGRINQEEYCRILAAYSDATRTTVSRIDTLNVQYAKARWYADHA